MRIRISDVANIRFVIGGSGAAGRELSLLALSKIA